MSTQVEDYPTTSLPPALRESRSRVGIVWYHREADAQLISDYYARHPEWCQSANLGIVQVGRDRAFDKVVDGMQLYAVVTP